MIAICAIIRDEHRDIREWAQHHLALGVDRIVLYDNDSTHGYQSELGDLDGIEMRFWPGNTDYRQRHVYEHFAASQAWTDDDWCLFIDADEFLHLEDHGDLPTLIAEYDDCAGIALSWRCFGADGHIRRPDVPLREAFTAPTPPIRERHNFKSLARLSEISFWADVHRFVPKNRLLVTVDREPVISSIVPQILEIAWIDHYITKSWEEYVQRLRRGNITKGIRRVEHFFAYNPEMEHQVWKLAGDLDQTQFPTLFNEYQKQRIDLHNKLMMVSAELDEASEHDDKVFSQCCVAGLIECCNIHLERLDETLRERMKPRFYDLIIRQIAGLNRIPRDILGYHDTVISNIISTPFGRLSREE